MTFKTSSRRPFWTGLSLAGIILLADQMSKYIILTYVMNPPKVINVLPIFDLVLVFNRGISFGLFSQNAAFGIYMLILLALTVTAALLYWMWRASTLYAGAAMGFIIGGALGNVIDRLRLGSVVDFLHFHWAEHSFPAFNVADSFITFGAALVLFENFFISEDSDVSTR